MSKTKENIYHDAISILNCLELVIDNKEQYCLIRKKMLDLANDVLRLGESDGK